MPFHKTNWAEIFRNFPHDWFEKIKNIIEIFLKNILALDLVNNMLNMVQILVPNFKEEN